jgi:hypothetical protein
MSNLRLSRVAFFVIPLLAIAAISRAQAPAQSFPVTSDEAGKWAKNEIALHACKVFRKNCYRCHKPGGDAERRMADALNRDKMVDAKKVIPGDLSSRVYQDIIPASKFMPYDGEIEAAPGDENLLSKSMGTDGRPTKLSPSDVVGIWILAGAPAWQTTTGMLGGMFSDPDCK